MNRFLKTTIGFMVVSCFVVVLSLWVLDTLGWSDDYYKRLRQSGNYSLVLGSSRAAHGINPDLFSEMLIGNDYATMQNFAFNVAVSPYGEIYYQAIKRKLDADASKKGLYILCVDPWSLSENSESDKGIYREEKRFLTGIHHYMHPNFEYFIKYVDRPIRLFPDKRTKLHNNGWLEVTVPMDSISVKKRHMDKMKTYRGYDNKRSEYRLRWLTNTIEMLKNRGDVFLVRMPIADAMLELENHLWPTFDKEILTISKAENVNYLSFMGRNSNYKTTDANHLYKKDAKLFSKELCDSINNKIH